MAEVITWRSMAGPNFSGTAAAMDAGADRINQMASTFQQLAQDQTRIQAEAKAKRRSENTARALSELTSINDLNALNQQMPNFSYDSLTGKYGEDIDAGLVSQTAAKQAGVIQENQIRDMDFNIAKEKPILGKASEEIAGLLNKGDFAGAKALYSTYMPQLTDATPLADMITSAETLAAENKFKQAELGIRQEEANRDAVRFQQEQDRIAKSKAYNEELLRAFKEYRTGNAESYMPDITKAPSLTEGYLGASQVRQQLLEESDLTPEVKNTLAKNRAIRSNNLAKAQERIDTVKAKGRETNPVVDPSLAKFYEEAPKSLKDAVSSAVTGSGVLLEVIKFNNPNIATTDFWEGIDVGLNDILDEVKERKIDLDNVPAEVVAAAAQGLVIDDSDTLSERDIDTFVRKIEDFQKKQNFYKNNAANEETLLSKGKANLDKLTALYNEREALEQKLEQEKRKDSLSLTYGDLLNRPAQMVEDNRNEDEVSPKTRLIELDDEILKLEKYFKLKD